MPEDHPRKKGTPFKPNFEDWNWGDKVETHLAALRDEIVDAISEGLEFSLAIWLYDKDDENKDDQFCIEAYIFDDDGGLTLAKTRVSITKLLDDIDNHVDEIKYARERFVRLAEELEASAKRVRDWVEKADASGS